MKMRIRELRRRKGLKQYELADAAGISRPYISAIESARIDKSPSTDTLIAIARVLGVRVGDLFDDAKPISVAGKVSTGARILPISDLSAGRRPYQIACPSDLPYDLGTVGVEIEGDSMLPLYRDGDILFYSYNAAGTAPEAINAICVCQDENSNMWVKYLKLGSEPNTFHLISLTPFGDNLFDVSLNWATPVRLAWPRDLVKRV